MTWDLFQYFYKVMLYLFLYLNSIPMPINHIHKDIKMVRIVLKDW